MNETIIQEDLTVHGNLVAKDGSISIGGNVAGDIDAKGIEILSHGSVKGGIEAEEVNISGSLEGSVKCSQLTLGDRSQLKADVTAGTMTMSAGAKVDGRGKVGGR